MTDFATIAAIGIANSLSICQHLFPLGMRRGNEFVVGDIYGNKGDSLSINLRTGIFKDFAGDTKGGDITALVAARMQLSMSDAAQWISERYGSDPIAPLPPVDEFVPSPPEREAEHLDIMHPTLGIPNSVSIYTDREGKTINCICRFEKDGKKVFRPLSWGTLKGKTGWHWKHLPAPRPLYNLKNLPETGKLILVEGEKACDALCTKMAGAHVLTWPGGADGVSAVDWSPLMSKKYDVLIWPDNDQAGHKAMMAIIDILKGKVASMGMLDVSSLPEKADAADFTGDVEDFIQRNRKAIKFEMVEPKLELEHKIPQRQPVASECKFDFDPLELPGPIGDTVRAITKNALQPQPELALLNTLAFAGAVFGRRYASPMNTRTNLYVVGIARTAGGKDHSRQYIANIAQKARLMEYMGANYIRSDTGMLVNLTTKPSQLMMVDEFGMYMEGISNPRAPMHIRNVSAVLTKLYTSSGSFYDHGQTADTKLKPIIIQAPNLCVYGTTTETNYIKALRKEAIESGELNRFIVYKSNRSFTGDEPVPPTREIPDTLVESWEDMLDGSSLGEIANLSEVPLDPTIVEWDDECKAIQRALYKRQQQKVNSGSPMCMLWGRHMENTIKIAMIFAIARNPRLPSFQKADFDVAQNIIDTCLGYMASLAEEHMAENEYEADRNKVSNCIKAAGKEGISKTKLARKFKKLKKKEIGEIISALIDQEIIEENTGNVDRKGQTGGTQPTVYRCLES